MAEGPADTIDWYFSPKRMPVNRKRNQPAGDSPQADEAPCPTKQALK